MAGITIEKGFLCIEGPDDVKVGTFPNPGNGSWLYRGKALYELVDDGAGGWELLDETAVTFADPDFAATILDGSVEFLHFPATGPSAVSTLEASSEQTVVNTLLAVKDSEFREIMTRALYRLRPFFDIDPSTYISGDAGSNLPTALSTVFEGTATASTNIHTTVGSAVSVPWDSTTNNAAYIDTHSDGDSTLVIEGERLLEIDFSVSTQEGANNRNTYRLQLVHTDSADVVKATFHRGEMYIRDDTNAYDSGGLGSPVTIRANDGDKLIVQVVTVDAQTVTATVNLTTAQSRILVRSWERQ